MLIISKRKAVTVALYRIDFEWKDQPGSGFSFPCDKAGNILLKDMPAPAQENWQKCLSGEYAVIAQGVKDHSYTFNESAHGACECGAVVILESSWSNSCEKCGREYNGGGQLLAPRSQWGDEWVTQPEEDWGLY